MGRRTQTTMVIRRNEDDYLTVTVEAEVGLTSTDVEIDRLTYREAFDEFPGAFPLTEREVEMAERALEEEAVEDARDRIEYVRDEKDALWEDHRERWLEQLREDA